jgi:hypothetical protein
MKPILLLVTAGICIANSICTTGTLASYELLGSGGCTIGADNVASFMAVSGTAGATAIDPTLITITPTGGTDNPVLTFQTSQTANAPTLLESIFNYTISGAAFTMDVLNLSGSSETGDGAVTDIQNYCFGGNFGPDGVTGCTGSVSGTLLGLDGIQNTDQTVIGGVTPLGITDDFTLDGGQGGSATGGVFADQFTATSATPEPGVLALTALGLSAVALRKIKERL